MQADGSRPVTTQYLRVTGSQSYTVCPLTRTVEVFDDVSQTWGTVAQTTSSDWYDITYNDENVRFDTRLYASLQTTYDNSVYQMRVKTEDPYSSDASNP